MKNWPYPTLFAHRGGGVLAPENTLAAMKMGHPFGHIIVVCIHTGLRRGEVATLKWSNITPETITIPAEQSKNGEAAIASSSEAADSICDIRKFIPSGLCATHAIANNLPL